MKSIFAPSALGLLIWSALLGLSQAAHASQCQLSGVVGSYGYTSTGTIVTPPVGVFAAVGHVTLSNAGTVTGAQTTSIAGNLIEETITGTFVVNPDCTGTATVYVYHGSTLARTSNLSVVWDHGSRELRAIFLSPGTSITITGRKMFPGDDD